MSVISGGLASDYNDMTVVGLRALQVEDYLSVNVFSNSDPDYTVQQNSAGFSVCALDTAVAFSVAKTENQVMTTIGWHEMTGYSTTGCARISKCACSGTLSSKHAQTTGIADCS